MNKNFIYKTRKTGRTGNESFEYIYWLLRSLNDGRLFKCTFKQLHYPFHNAPMSIELPIIKYKNCFIKFNKNKKPRDFNSEALNSFLIL